MTFYRSLSNRKSLQVSGALLSILAYFSSLDVLDSAFDRQFSQSLSQVFGDYSKGTNYNWYHRHFHVRHFFRPLGKMHYYYTSHKFFALTLAGGLSRESDWQQVSGLQDSSHYSGYSQQCCNLDGLDSSSDFQFFRLSFLALGNSSKCTIYNWYHRHLHVPKLFSSLAKSKYLSIFLSYFLFTRYSVGITKSTIRQILFLFFFLLSPGLVFLSRWSVSISKSQRIIRVSFSRSDSRLCIYYLVV